MTPLEKQAYEWALNQKYESVSARYARILAQYIEREAAELATLTAERDGLRALVERLQKECEVMRAVLADIVTSPEWELTGEQDDRPN